MFLHLTAYSNYVFKQKKYIYTILNSLKLLSKLYDSALKNIENGWYMVKQNK